jgi:cytidyltransferase-like protein
MKSLVIGRFQPFHDGHYALVQTLLDEGKDVVVAIRDTPFNEDNPYSVFERRQMIHHALGDGVETVVIPDIEEVIYGRKVGWKIREIILDESTQGISATAIRKPKILWLTGNSRAGKTTLARNLQKRLPAVILDGDEMRMSISTDKGFSLTDRLEHNKRVARLARVLQEQGQNVIVSVIAPTHRIRSTVDKICRPKWIYVKRESLGYDPEKPYEPPENPDLTVDNDTLSEDDAAEQVWKFLSR